MGDLLKNNYLNNRDILKEIHSSKSSYCSYIDKEAHHQYDLIVKSKDSINRTSISKARAAKIARLERETKEEIKPKTIKKTDLIFRVMTWDHIPLAPPKQSKNQKNKNSNKILNGFNLDDLLEIEEDSQDDEEIIIPAVTVIDKTHIKLNFPPFVHYKFDDSDNLIMVGKSHWIGDFETGHFSKTHGRITDTLAHMILQLCERYSTRPNWRNYTYNEEMRAQAILQLAQVCLQFDESKSENPFSYFTMVAQNSFTRILNVEKRNQSVRDDLLEKHGLSPSFARQTKNAHLD